MRLFSTIATLAVLSSASASPLDKRNTACTSITSSQKAAVKNAFSTAKIIPQAVSANIDPNFPMLYAKGAYGSRQFNLGNTLTVLNTTQTPTFNFTGEPGYDAAKTKYMLIYCDPDAPGPTGNGAPASLAFFLHQATYNLQPECIKNQSPTTVTVPGYRPLTPLSTARHRYTELIYRQPPNFTPPTQLALTTSNFDLNGFVKQNKLVLVGGNFIREGALDVVAPSS